MLLNQVLAAAGGTSALAEVQDVTSAGSVTYYWAGQEVQGTAKALARGPDQFRLDVTLPQGLQTWVVNQGKGALRDANGTTNRMRYQDAVNLGGFTFPYFELLAAARNTSTSIVNFGSRQLGIRQVYQIRIQQNLPPGTDPSGILSSLTIRDYFVDASNHQVVRIQDTKYPEGNTTTGYSHVVDFADYRTVSGVQVPFSITESNEDQRTWTIQLNSVAFNAGLSDTSFQF
jgi:outer membrane lipoprotein-sorting protein